MSNDKDFESVSHLETAPEVSGNPQFTDSRPSNPSKLNITKISMIEPDESPRYKPILYWIPRERLEDSSKIAEMRPDSPEWTSQELHLFIVTDAGKPVYSRYGTVQMLSPILCTCVAILGHMETLGEELNHFRAGNHTFVFLPKKPFVFIAVSKSSLPVSYLFKQLNFLYSLFLSLFSEKVINQISQRPSCDFRQIAEGTKPAWDGVVNNMSEDPAFIFAPSIPVSNMIPELRQKITKYFEKIPSCRLSMLMRRNRIIAIGNHSCDSLSLRLIVDLVWTPPFLNGESFTPFFVRELHHLYINKHRNSDYCLVMLCKDETAFAQYHGAALKFFKELEESYLNKLSTQLVGAPEIFYCWAVHSITYGQIYITDPKPEVFDDPNPKVARQKMQELCRQLAKSCEMVDTNAVDGEYMFRDEKEVIVAYRNKEMELYAVAKTEDLPDSLITEKLNELRVFVNSHLNEIIITETKFHVEKFV